MVAAASAAVAQQQSTSLALGLDQGLVVLMLTLGFFLLRVFDEHKDFEKDVIAHPERLLSQGLITLNDLKWAGVLSVILQLSVATYLGVGVLVWVVVYLLFSVAMRFEFGISRWLNQHIVIYALTHNPIVALMMMAAVATASGGLGGVEGAVLWWLLVATFTSLGFEIGRKVRATEDERAGQDTYTSALGIGRSVALLLLCELFAVAFAVPLLQSNVGWVGLMAMAIVMGFGPLRFYRTPTSKNASLVETTSTLGALGVYILIAVDTGLIWGVVWS